MTLCALWKPRAWTATLALTVVLAGCGGIGGVEPAPAAAPSNADGGAGTPTINGQPGAAVAPGRAYVFQPSVTGADAEGLTFAASNLPGWLAIDAQTGRLSGTPTSADIGTYSGITLTVSNGASRSTLGPFSITVAEGGDGRATLSWMPPSLNTDGSALTNLAGFVVLYGTSPSNLSQSISISNPSVSTYIVEDLGPGTWYFAVQAVNSAGMSSEPSVMASKSIS